MKIGPFTFQEYLDKVKAFHGNTAPGVVLGGVMVSVARQNLPENILFDAIAETDKCVPDAIQLLTPCTFGNGWMRIFNSGRFALCLYNKESGEGIRVSIDPEKLKNVPEINDWFFVLKPKKEQSKENILAAIEKSGSEILKVQPIKVDINSLPGKYDGKYAICSKCHESYPANDEGLCLDCQGKMKYSK